MSSLIRNQRFRYVNSHLPHAFFILCNATAASAKRQSQFGHACNWLAVWQHFNHMHISNMHCNRNTLRSLRNSFQCVAGDQVQASYHHTTTQNVHQEIRPHHLGDTKVPRAVDQRVGRSGTGSMNAIEDALAAAAQSMTVAGLR